MPLVMVNITLFWRWEDGDGSVCFICGDRAWLKQRRLTTQIDSLDEQLTRFVACASCGELIDRNHE